MTRASAPSALCLILALVLTSCAANEASGADETTTSKPVTTSSTTTTTTTSSTTTSSTTTTTTTLPPVQVSGVFPDVAAAAALGPIPDDVDLSGAVTSKPLLYDNGCHAGVGAVTPAPCEFGDLTSDTVIVVTGDSHAAQWFGALETAAVENHWRLVTLTKSSCPAADVNTTRREQGESGEQIAYPECAKYRHSSWETILSLHPDLVVYPMLTRYHQADGGGISGWTRGLARSISAIAQPGTKALVIGETPKTLGDEVPACIRNHRSDISTCANRRSRAEYPEKVSALADVAHEHNAMYVNPVDWICDTETCPVVIGGHVVYRDYNHMSDAFSRYRAPQMAEVIRQALDGPDAV